MRRLAVSCEKRIAESKQNGNARCCHTRHADCLRNKEDKPGEDCQVHSGYNKQVERTCTLKARAHTAREIAAVAAQHRRQHGRVFAVQPQASGQLCRVSLIFGKYKQPCACVLLDRVQPAGE